MKHALVTYADGWAGHRGYVAVCRESHRTRRYNPTTASFDRLGRIVGEYYCARITRCRSQVEISDNNKIPPRWDY